MRRDARERKGSRGMSARKGGSVVYATRESFGAMPSWGRCRAPTASHAADRRGDASPADSAVPCAAEESVPNRAFGMILVIPDARMDAIAHACAGASVRDRVHAPGAGMQESPSRSTLRRGRGLVCRLREGVPCT